MGFLALFTNPVTRKLILFGIAAVAALAALGYFIHYERMVGAEQLVAKEQARANDVSEWAAKWAVGSVSRVDELEQKNVDLVARSQTASASNRGKPCFDRAAVDRLRAITSPHAAH